MRRSTGHPMALASGRRTNARRRGSAYIAVLAISALVVLIGIGALTATRLTARGSQLTNDAAKARPLARSAIELALLHIENHSITWRQDLADGAVLQDQPLGDGTITLHATDPNDGNLLDDSTDNVLLRGEGRIDRARTLIEVRLNGDGRMIRGSWRIATD